MFTYAVYRAPKVEQWNLSGLEGQLPANPQEYRLIWEGELPLPEGDDVTDAMLLGAIAVDLRHDCPFYPGDVVQLTGKFGDKYFMRTYIPKEPASWDKGWQDVTTEFLHRGRPITLRAVLYWDGEPDRQAVIFQKEDIVDQDLQDAIDELWPLVCNLTKITIHPLMLKIEALRQGTSRKWHTTYTPDQVLNPAVILEHLNGKN